MPRWYLADEMGMGKTIEVLSLIAKDKEDNLKHINSRNYDSDDDEDADGNSAKHERN